MLLSRLLRLALSIGARRSVLVDPLVRQGSIDVNETQIYTTNNILLNKIDKVSLPSQGQNSLV